MSERTNATHAYTHFRAGYIRPCPNSCSRSNGGTFGNTGADCHKSPSTYTETHHDGNSAAYAHSTADTGACSHSDSTAHRNPGAYGCSHTGGDGRTFAYARARRYCNSTAYSRANA